METCYKKKIKTNKKGNKDVLLKLTLVFAPVLFFLTIYLICGVMFSYTSKSHSRLNYHEKVNSLLNMVKESIVDEEKDAKKNTYLQD